MVAIERRTARKHSRTRRARTECRNEPTDRLKPGVHNPAARSKAPATGVVVRSSPDIVQARQRAREVATEMGFGGSDVTRIASAISEIARNILDYARAGEIEFQPIAEGKGLMITARDHGPGNPDVSPAMQYGYSSGTGLGVGLPGARWLMDEFNIESAPGKGTVVRMTKWLA